VTVVTVPPTIYCFAERTVTSSTVSVLPNLGPLNGGPFSFLKSCKTWWLSRIKLGDGQEPKIASGKARSGRGLGPLGLYNCCDVGQLRWPTKGGDPWPPLPDLMVSETGAIPFNLLCLRFSSFPVVSELDECLFLGSDLFVCGFNSSPDGVNIRHVSSSNIVRVSKLRGFLRGRSS
jgi:hypothetical protein